MRVLNLVILTIFAGSLFLTSGRFVNETNAPKLYYVVSTLLVIAAFSVISQNRLNFCAIKSKTILWGINIICFLQTCYGLFQFVDWHPSHHSKFAITGSFDNPAGFAAVLAMGFPIGMFLIAKAKKVKKYWAIIILMVVAITVFLSGSRTGLLAVVISSAVFILFEASVISKLQQLRYYKLLSTLILICFVFGASVLYRQKKDSAIGRVLIWKVSSEMIKDKPVFGHGYGSFKAKYMDYQAKYFIENPDSGDRLLADNVKHPFNEFIQLGVEFGFVGLLLVGLIISIIILRIKNSQNEYKYLALSGIISFFTFATFS